MNPKPFYLGGLKGNFSFLRGISFNLPLDLQNNLVIRILVYFLKDFHVL